MILSFKSRFVPLIERGYFKMNTIRKSGRWKKGDLIHFYEGNPRNGGKPFGTGEVKNVTPIVIDPFENTIEIIRTTIRHPGYLDAFARTDGFTSWEDMKTFFPKRFEGDFIEWGTSFKPIKS